MRKLGGLLLLAGATALAGLILSACGGGSSSSGGTEGGTATVLMGTAPDYLDPQEMYTTQGYEPGWITWTGLLTYKHEDGQAGTELIPGLATDLGQVSADNKTYTYTLRKGLVYSDGTPSDQAQLGRQELLHGLHRGRRGLRRRQGERHFRHRHG